MFEITIETSFAAKHRLKLSDGSAEPLHEHQWKVIAAVCCEQLNDMGCVMDFHVLGKIVDGVLEPMVGTELERFGYFLSKGINASAENVCKYVYDSVLPELPENVELSYVKVMESAGCWAKYAKL